MYGETHTHTHTNIYANTEWNTYLSLFIKICVVELFIGSIAETSYEPAIKNTRRDRCMSYVCVCVCVCTSVFMGTTRDRGNDFRADNFHSVLLFIHKNIIHYTYIFTHNTLHMLSVSHMPHLSMCVCAYVLCWLIYFVN